MSKNTFHLVSLGCAKNTVDSDSMEQLLVRDGYHAVDNPSHANVLIVNTCGFIGPAKQESLDVLRELADGKKKNQILIAAGCLTQRYGSEVAEKVPGIDGVLGTRRWMDIVQVVRELRKAPHPEPIYHLPPNPKPSARMSRRLSVMFAVMSVTHWLLAGDYRFILLAPMGWAW